MPEVRRLQEEFQQRWLALVGPVPITGPTEATHSTEILTEALKRTLEK